MEAIYSEQKALTDHPVYKNLNNIQSIRHFMEYHVFAVWDFMSLLKSLQRQITTVQLPWRPSPFPSQMVRFINQIVVGEESDLDQNGEAISHFELYLRAMEEVGADTSRIKSFLKTGDLNLIPNGAREFVIRNLEVAENGSLIEVASSFFYGREKLIPEMFQMILTTLKAENIYAPTFIYYLERHIDVDGNEHGPLALKCLECITQGQKELLREAEKAGLRALKDRALLWDAVLQSDQN